MNESELTGLLLVVVLIALFIITMLALNKKDNDLSEILKESCDEADSQSKGVIIYKLKHYDLQFNLIGEVWYPSIKIGDHTSRIYELEERGSLKAMMFETLLHLNVKQEDQLA